MASAVYLRPKSLTELFGASVRLYRAHGLTFVGLVALVQIPGAILQFLHQLWYDAGAVRTLSDLALSMVPGAAPLDAQRTQSLLWYIGTAVLIWLVQVFIVQTLSSGALISAARQAYFQRPVSFLAAYGSALKRFGSLSGVAALLMFGWVLVVALAVAPPSLLLFTTPNGADSASVELRMLLAAVLLVGLVLVGALIVLLATVLLLFATQEILLEGKGPGAALQRSWQLVRGSFWRVCGGVVAMSVLVFCTTSLPASAIQTLLSLVYARELEAQIWINALNVFLVKLGTVLTMPLQLTFYTLLYYDLRVRKEGFGSALDLSNTLAAEAAGL